MQYYDGDYQSISAASLSSANHFLADLTSSSYGAGTWSLYNGNIGRMTTSIEGFDSHGNAYLYDQLQRLRKTSVYTNLDSSANAWLGSSPSGDYDSYYSYDLNGNIDSLSRNGMSAVQQAMDRMRYHYNANTNQLNYVSEAASDHASYDDIKTGQSSNNYAYDANGNLIKDVASNISKIVWTNSGKVDSIFFSSGSYAALYFEYDPLGNRVQKTAKKSNGDLDHTLYIKDATGNTLSTYSYTEESTGKQLMLKEHSIYGSSRLGLYNRQLALYDSTSSGIDSLASVDSVSYTAGIKQYELSNHLGNVLAVVSDKLTWKDDNANDSTDAFSPSLLSKNDYYPFGMIQAGRSYNAGDYRYGFQGQEKDDEIKGTGNSINYKYRMHDPRVGRFFAVDPLSAEYPFYSPYAFSGNRVVDKIELEGLEPAEIEEQGGRPAVSILGSDELNRNDKIPAWTQSRERASNKKHEDGGVFSPGSGNKDGNNSGDIDIIEFPLGGNYPEEVVGSFSGESESGKVVPKKDPDTFKLTIKNKHNNEEFVLEYYDVPGDKNPGRNRSSYEAQIDYFQENVNSEVVKSDTTEGKVNQQK